MLDLSRFDKVYCVHYLPFDERFDDMKNGLARIGIDTNSKKFQWKLTFDSPFFFYLFNNPYFKIVKDNKYFFDGNKKCTLAHYEIYKEALGMGYERILVCEDDMVFLRNEAELAARLEMMPNMDIVLFDKWMFDKEKYADLVENRRINECYSEYDDGMLSTGFYSITRRGMEHIVREQEFYFQPADFWINRQNIGSEEDNLTRAFSIKNLAIQNFSFDKLVNGKKQLFYSDMSFYHKIIDLGEYDIENKQLLKEKKVDTSEQEGQDSKDKEEPPKEA